MGDPKGFGPAAAALILGLLGCVLLVFSLGIRNGDVPSCLAGLSGLLGLIPAIVGCTGHRRGKPLAVAGAILSGLALVLAVNMLLGFIPGP